MRETGSEEGEENRVLLRVFLGKDEKGAFGSAVRSKREGENAKETRDKERIVRERESHELGRYRYKRKERRKNIKSRQG